MLGNVIILLLVGNTSGSIYFFEGIDSIPSYEHAEKMYGTDLGPPLGDLGESFIEMFVNRSEFPKESTQQAVVLFYHTDTLSRLEMIRAEIEFDACMRPDAPEEATVEGLHDWQRHVYELNVNTTSDLHVKYVVNRTGWIDAHLYICSSSQSAHGQVPPFQGKLTVQNPYGYLPAVLYGLLPFSAFVTAGYAILVVAFTCLYIRHRKQVLPLQLGILLTLVLGTIATGCWLYALYIINLNGEPICCPYPFWYLVSIILDGVMRTFARVVLLLVTIGYGTVRDRLTKTEIVAIMLLSCLYGGSTIADRVYRGTGNEVDIKPTYWSFVELVCNLIFVMWIYVSLENITKDLQTQKQTAKLKMYQSLSCALATFIFFFTLLTIVVISSRVGVFQWPIEWEWVQLVVWPVLNVTVSATLSFIWRPTHSSSQYAYSVQLPQNEEDIEQVEEDDDEEIEIELTVQGQGNE